MKSKSHKGIEVMIRRIVPSYRGAEAWRICTKNTVTHVSNESPLRYSSETFVSRDVFARSGGRKRSSSPLSSRTTDYGLQEWRKGVKRFPCELKNNTKFFFSLNLPYIAFMSQEIVLEA